MKKMLSTVFAFVLAAGIPTGFAAEAEIELSVKKEARAALARGVDYLLNQQNEDGSWQNHPAITALAITALHESGLQEQKPEIPAAVEKGREYVLDFVQDNGAIYNTEMGYINYTTAVSLSALAIIDKEADRDIMREARHYLIDSQLDEDHPEHPTKPDNPFYGGIGYGSAGPTRPDLSNTQLALEALYLTEHLDKETEYAEKSELAWDKALKFLEEVQNVPADAGKAWVVADSDDPNMDGGFIYKPTESKATSKLQKQGEDVEGLRSYGSMTYAGLKSMIYAELDKDDYRVKAAVDWARNNYVLSENPGMGAEGHYYYLQTFAKALNAYGKGTLETEAGKVRNWREDLLLKLIELQKADGQWFNEKHSRWMESIPELVTAYSLIAMEVALSE